MVIDDHRAGHRGEQPANRRVTPRFTVEPRVLLEVGDLLAGLGAGGAPSTNEGAGLRRGVIGVDLIADHEQQRRPLAARLARQSRSQGAERIHPAGALCGAGQRRSPSSDTEYSSSSPEANPSVAIRAK